MVRSILMFLTIAASVFATAGTIAHADAAADGVRKLKAAGAVFVPMSQMPNAAKSLKGSGGASEGAEGCRGVSACLDLIESRKCESFRCNNDHGQPACWCEY